jgi:leucyl-tRNA synthetase
LKYGFYELQTARDWYREVTGDVGMHADLVQYWIRISALLILPIAPHFSEHIWTSVLGEPETVQNARWPTPSTTLDKAVLDAGAYVRSTVKNLRDAELALLKKMNKGKAGQAQQYDPKKPRSVRVVVATGFPEWQNTCVQIVREAYDKEKERVDDAKVRALLTERGLIKDKRAMPFVQAFKVRYISRPQPRYSLRLL